MKQTLLKKAKELGLHLGYNNKLEEFIEKSKEEFANHPAMKFANDAIVLQAVRSGTSGFKGEEHLGQWLDKYTVSLLQEVKKDLQQLCNKSRTERGLATALGNYISKLSEVDNIIN